MILVGIKFGPGYVSSHRILVIEGSIQELYLHLFSILPNHAITM